MKIKVNIIVMVLGITLSAYWIQASNITAPTVSAIIEKAVQKINHTHALSYQFHRTATGILSHHYPEVKGEAYLEMEKTVDLFNKAAIYGDNGAIVSWVENETVYSKNDAGTYVWKAPMYRNGTEILDESFFALSFLMSELKESATAGIFQGEENVNGIPCYKIYYNADPLNYLWYIGKEDGWLYKLTLSGEQFGDATASLAMWGFKTGQQSKAVWHKINGYKKLPQKEYSGSGLTIGEKVPDWETIDYEGKTIRLSDYKGKVVIVDFWATWCRPCLQAMPHLNELQQHYKQVEVIGLTHQESGDPMKLAAKKGLTYQIAKGDAIAPTYKVNGLPYLYVVDEEGRLLDYFNGYFGSKTDHKLDELLRKYLKK